MKPTIIVCLLVLMFSGTVFGKEIKKDTLEIGGALNAAMFTSKLKSEGNPTASVNSTGINIETIQYVARNVGFGLLFKYDVTTVKVNGSKLSTQNVVFGPTVLYNFSLTERSSVKLSGTVAYVGSINRVTNKQPLNINERRMDSVMYVSNIKYSSYINDSISLDVIGSYSYIQKTKLGVVGASVGLSVYLK